ncbi:transglutaminase family protein [Catenovulum sediminis]|uniref:Transglutaminase family protein n=1 Tax=Catenovulum sediminis TaxID=1740262 RepID=A0ABV1RGQ3_9ALTE|nr:transglutaminase family protein [Catenovulum sediminis]
MKRYSITHSTHYQYSGFVELGLHYMLLRPREDHELRIESFSLNITPDYNLLWHRDVENNSVAEVSFKQNTAKLTVESEVIIQQFNESPLDFLVADYAVYYPFKYRQGDQVLLQPYMRLTQPEDKNIIQQWLASIWQADEKIQTYTLLKRLAESIHNQFTYRIREEAGVQSPSFTLTHKTGSCRDFAALFIEAARFLGLACRFVSGYLYAPALADMAGATHAWAEVYLPGAGWKGFDPTVGCIVGADHIAVAVARLPESVPPVQGCYTGNQSSVMDVGVWVKLIES